MTKKERVLAVMKKEQVDMIPAGFWFHYKSDYTVQQMIDEHMKLFRTTAVSYTHLDVYKRQSFLRFYQICFMYEQLISYIKVDYAPISVMTT